MWRCLRTSGQSSTRRASTRMHSQTLIDALLALDEGRWKRANGGRPIDAYYLREHLADVITVNTPELKKARKWRGPGGYLHGYTEDHFADAWSALPRQASSVEVKAFGGPAGYTSPRPPISSGPSGPSGPSAKNDDTSKPYAGPDSGPDGEPASGPDGRGPDGQPASGPSSGPAITEPDQPVTGNGPDGPDGPDGKGGFRKHMPVGAKRRRTARPSNGPDAPKSGDA